jgi:hypothetical protein
MSEQKIEYVVRLRPDVYASLEKQLPRPVVTDNTSPLQAGYQLGVQAVLKLLREGFTQE